MKKLSVVEDGRRQFVLAADGDCRERKLVYGSARGLVEQERRVYQILVHLCSDHADRRQYTQHNHHEPAHPVNHPNVLGFLEESCLKSIVI